MAKLPGLDRHSDDVVQSRSNGRTSRGRVVTNTETRRMPGLTPTAAPVDTFARPEQAPKDDNLMRLAESLSALNPQLARYAAVKKEAKDETLTARVAQRYAGKTYEEAQELYKTDPDAQTLLGKRAIAANVGRAYAQQLGRQAADHYETEFDKDGGDLDGYLNGLQRQAIESHPDDPFFAEQFSQVFEPMAASIRAEHTKYGVSRTQEKVAETVQGSWLGTVQAGILQDVDPMTIAENLRSSYETNRAGLKMSFPDQDKAMVGVIQQLTLQMDREPGQAEKLYGVIQALAANPRTAADGTQLGRLLDSSSLGPDVAKLLSGAEAKITGIRELESYKTLDAFDIQAENGNLDEEALDAWYNDPKNKGVMTPGRRSSLLSRDRTAKEQAANALIKNGEKERVRQDIQDIRTDALSAGDAGNLSWVRDAEYVDENGAVKTVSVEIQRRNAAEDFITREQRRVQLDPRDQNTVAVESFNRQVQFFAGNGLEHPQWSQTLKAGAASMSTVQAGGSITDATKQGYDLYKQLYAKNPNYLRTQLSSDEANVYEAARVLEETGVASNEEALTATQRYYADPTRASDPTANVKAAEIREAIKARNGQGGFLGLFKNTENLPTFENPDVMNGEVAKLANVLVGAGGLDPATAVTKATESVVRGYQTVNGWAVKTSDRNVPANFGDMASRYLKEWHGNFGADNGLEFDDITIAALPNSSAGWMIVNKSTGLPVLHGDQSVLTMGDLDRMRQKDRDAVEQRVIEDNAKRQQRVQKDAERRQRLQDRKDAVQSQRDAAAAKVKDEPRNEPLFNRWGIKIGRPRWAWSQEDSDAFKAK